jgi:hypothetical protein
MADEVPTDAVAIERAPAPETPRSERVRLLTLDHLDGRTLAAKRVRELEAAIVADKGGEEHVSSMRRALVRRAAVLCAVLEDHEARWVAGEAPLDTDAYLPGVNALGRLLERIGLDRTARTVRTLREHLEASAE